MHVLILWMIEMGEWSFGISYRHLWLPGHSDCISSRELKYGWRWRARHWQILKAEGCSGVYIPPQKDTNWSICWMVLDVACRAARDHSWLVKILCYLQTCRSALCAHRCHENIWLWLLLIQMMKRWWKDDEKMMKRWWKDDERDDVTRTWMTD